VKIYISSLFEMPVHVRERGVGYLVSVVQPAFQPARPPEVAPERHLRLEIDDISTPVEGAVLPERPHVHRLIEFLRRWPGDEPLLIHCYAGISRSPAAALVALSLWQDELEAARALRAAAPHAIPNARLIALADEVLDRRGRLVAAREAMGPFLPASEGPLVELALPRPQVNR
jgi:predicted protein tyrosine phosphatase